MVFAHMSHRDRRRDLQHSLLPQTCCALTASGSEGEQPRWDSRGSWRTVVRRRAVRLGVSPSWRVVRHRCRRSGSLRPCQSVVESRPSPVPPLEFPPTTSAQLVLHQELYHSPLSYDLASSCPLLCSLVLASLIVILLVRHFDHVDLGISRVPAPGGSCWRSSGGLAAAQSRVQGSFGILCDIGRLSFVCCAPQERFIGHGICAWNSVHAKDGQRAACNTGHQQRARFRTSIHASGADLRLSRTFRADCV